MNASLVAGIFRAISLHSTSTYLVTPITTNLVTPISEH